jgi:MYXO-CTERM domain-containing protein
MTASAWGTLVRNMDPGYTGRRPRLQMYQGDADTTISYKNMGEAIKEWTNVLTLPTTPTSTQNGYVGAQATWNIQRWANACGYNVLEAWTAPGATHSMSYEEAEMLKFFGLDTAAHAAGSDPEAACNGGAGGAGGGAAGAGGAGGAKGSGGAGGSTGGGGAGGMKGSGGTVGSGGNSGQAGSSGAAGGGGSGSGGNSATGGTPGSGGNSATGGNTGSGGASAKGGGSGSGGAVGSGGNTGSGGNSSTGSGGNGSTGSGGNGNTGSGGDQGSGGSGSGGSSGTGSGGSGSTDNGTTGCSCALGSDGSPVSLATALLLAAFGLLARRRPQARVRTARGGRSSGGST